MPLLNEKLDALQSQGVTPKLCQSLGEYVRDNPPPLLLKISPYRLAGDWGTSLRDTLNAFLRATRLGIFDLEWDIRCPSCKGSTQLTERLNQLRAHSSCGYCRIDILGGFDDAVEVTFRVNANVRGYEEPSINEIIGARNVMESPVQVLAKAAGAARLELDLAVGTHHLFTADMSAGAPIRVAGNPASERREVVYHYDGTDLHTHAGADFQPGPVTLVVQNDSDADLGLIFARAKEFPWVSGNVVACNQEFRDLFTEELIHPDETFAIQNTAFVFTDIRGSTELYERLGDSKAYALVRDHFTIITETIKGNGGAVVKTIGDAVMAAFPVSGDAMESVLHMHEAFEAFNTQEQTRDDVIIKVGMHRGPCIAVSSNDRLDYFGRTVNIAARVQGKSVGGDVVLSKSLAEEPDIRDRIAASPWHPEVFHAELKGIEEALEVVRLTRT